MESPAAVGAAHGADRKAVIASKIIADFCGEVHAADLIRDLILIALDATESPDMTDRNRLEARAALAEALDLIEGAAQQPEKRTIRQAIYDVALATGISAEKLVSPCRLAKTCRARELACYIARQNGYSYGQIARVFGRDHSTIVSAVKNETRRRQGCEG